jgi:hypothetical protein
LRAVQKSAWNVLGEITPTTGRLPYLFGLYVFFAMGVGRLYALIGDFPVTGLMGGLLWVLVGIFVLRRFSVYADAEAAADEGRKQLIDTMTSGTTETHAPD